MKKLLFVVILSIPLLFFLASTPIFAQESAQQPAQKIEGSWVEDSEVTFVGKMATRSDDFLNWTLQNYDWIKVGNNQENPLTQFYVLIRNIVYGVIILFVLVAAFILIITRGQNLTIMKFIPRFVMVVILVTLSFSIVQGMYLIADLIQGWMLHINGFNKPPIGSSDLLHIAFDYQNFGGFRRVGSQFDESAFISLLLVRLTAFTYYTMTGILLVRKIILWFFIIISPIFPLLLFYAPIRNTAKIWLGEFFRWLLYGPLFAVFLRGLVVLWSNPNGLPLPFDFSGVQKGDVVYPTSVNILLGGPGQAIGLANSVNLKDTFALYVVALLMLWVVTLLPFLLLNIFLDYLNTISIKDNTMFKKVIQKSTGFLPSRGYSPTPPGLPPLTPTSTGMAKILPFLNKQTNTIASTISSSTNTYNNTQTLSSVRATTDIMRTANLSVPKMRDIARYETSQLSRSSTRTQEISHVNSTLEKIANPSTVTSATERQQFTTMREKLVQQQQKGDPLATSILSASTIVSQGKTVGAVANSALQNTSMSQTGTQMEQITKENQKNSSIMGQKTTSLPIVNRVQQVSLEDYEEVKKMWVENYQNLDAPKSIDGKEMSKKEWVKGDIEKINQAVTLLTAVDPVKNQQGMQMVANILPFLLIGGFSKTEVIAYLKAKLEAAKSVVSEMSKKDEEEDTFISRSKEKNDEAEHMSAQAHIPEEVKKSPDENKEHEL